MAFLTPAADGVKVTSKLEKLSPMTISFGCVITAKSDAFKPPITTLGEPDIPNAPIPVLLILKVRVVVPEPIICTPKCVKSFTIGEVSPSGILIPFPVRFISADAA